MLPAMRLARPARGIAPFAIALSLWTALPSLEWCPLSWDECEAACEVGARSAAHSGAGAGGEVANTCRPGAAQAGASCGPTAAQAGASCAGACPPRRAATGASQSAPAHGAPAGDRAWCIHPPADGVPTRATALRGPSSASPALAPLAHDPITRVAVRIARWVAEVYSPSEADAHARPPTRAPPLI